MLSEEHLIAHLKQAFPECIGDDAAVLPRLSQGQWVVTKDILVEQVHFRRRYTPPEALAHKALHVNLSDLAAMGATPQYVLLGLSIPANIEDAWMGLFLDAFCAVCRDARVILVGGDTTAAAGDEMYISITAMGVVEPSQLKTRTKARPHQVIALAGELGFAHLGFCALESGWDGLDDVKQAFLRPRARVAEGQWLGHEPGVKAMMDTSDGLFVDLTRLCQASGVGAVLELESIPCKASFKSACVDLNLDPRVVQLSGGEDYGLLIAVDEETYPNLSHRFAEKFGYALIQLGHLTEGHEIRFLEQGAPVTLALQLFSHFKP